MSSINLVNLNDAMYMEANKPYNYVAGITAEHFSPSKITFQFPLLKQGGYTPETIPSWCDWIKILGGNPETQISTTSGADTIATPVGYRIMYDQRSNNYTYGRTWGKTFGKPRGPGGTPLSEHKPLDEMYWYYQDVTRQIRTTTPAVSHESCIFDSYCYNETAWSHSVENPDPKYNVVRTTRTVSATLQPGLHMAVVNSHCAGSTSGRVSWAVMQILTDEEKGTWSTIMEQAVGSATWVSQNTMFFVDSPTQIRGYGTASADWNCMRVELAVWKVTPDGYWEL